MKTIPAQYEQFYRDASSAHHHSYLLPPLLDLISQQQHNSSKKLRVLDLGCGNGSLSQKIAEQGYELIGVNESASGILFASENFQDCKFIQASLYDLPYSDWESTFDIVISAEVIEHLLYLWELIRCAKKCLKPKGKLILTTPYHGYWKNLILSLFGKMDGDFTVLWDGGQIKFFSVATLAQLLQEEGFTQINFKFAGRIPYLWKSMLCSCSVANKLSEL
ncbi:Methyltransferase type 11 (plasmid) [Gloeothece citriformis PCC 7424]|uniref:Methyltransferase type 11 n=1 Tax=Gloeothece citriformis (strain PCC 7424) TaxID=65393 RepID=B7KM34_GLOC7|nr:class I SAM-dependent methyltransferase [Gloeothece citriformis]ACK73856.1 Methyltransferase type 11 [Gloeothece citriformis PCC 7424]